MTDTKIPMRIFTSYEALTEYYGERPDMELGLYVSDEKLLVGHAPTAYSFNPQYFTDENELMPDYVPESPIDYTITATSNNTTYGYVTGGGTYPQHSEITLNAYAYNGYKFDKWSNGVETSAYTFAVEEDANLVGNFADNTYTVTIHEPAPELITTTGAGVYIAGTSVTVTATPAEGYYFAGWLDLDTTYFTTDTTYTFIIDRNTNFQASVAPYLTVSATPNNVDYGSTTGSGNQYEYNDSVTVTATANTGYRFVNWTEGGVEVSTDTEYTFTVYDDTALVANFALITYTVTVSANDSSYGTVTGGGEYARGSNVTINAIPNSGYRFVNWTQGGIQVVTHPEYTLTLLSDATFVANFEEDPYAEPFYVENITNDVETLTIDKMRESSLPSSGDPSPDITVEYSTDKTTWTSLGTTTFAGPALTMSLNPGDKVYLRANTTRWGTNDANVKIYNNITGISRVGGNIMSLLYGSNFTGQEKTFRDTIGFDFYRVFYQNSVLLDSSKLICPAETLYTRSYNSMFANCPNLVTSPILDFTNMAVQPGSTYTGICCGWMFENDTSLVNAPELKCTTILKDCYNGMFKGCTSLVAAPALPATTLAISCYHDMFYGCTSLTTAPTLPATTLAHNCYQDMFRGCTALTTAPELPATTLANACYREMFYGCTSLNTIKCLATSGITTSNLGQWVNTVSSTGTFTKAAGVEYSTGNSGIPTGWTVVEV